MVEPPGVSDDGGEVGGDDDENEYEELRAMYEEAKLRTSLMLPLSLIRCWIQARNE